MPGSEAKVSEIILPPFGSANGGAKADRRCNKLDLPSRPRQSVSAELPDGQTVLETLLTRTLATNLFAASLGGHASGILLHGVQFEIMTKRKLKDLPNADRPREKLAAKGAASLSDLELLMALIGSGNAQADVASIARDVKKLLLDTGSELTYEDLLTVKSLGPAKATIIMAGFELWRRQFEVTERPIIDSPEKAVEQLADIRHKKQEHFVCLTLDGANRLIAKRIITIGTLTSSLVHPREVFADAITDRAASIIVAHNHPSGNLELSAADQEITLKLTKAGALLGMPLVDHIIVSNDHFSSVKPTKVASL